jgi:hypothetical protein
MSKIVRYEFEGSWILFQLLCVTLIGIPYAVLYLLNGTVRIETEVDDPERLVQQLHAGKLTHK